MSILRPVIYPFFVWGLAAITTMALFLTMKVLITGQDFELEEALANISIDFIRVARDEDIENKDRKPKRPERLEPDEPPPPPKLDQVPRPNIDKATTRLDLGEFALAGINLDAPVDGDALAIVRVLPRYPSRALSRGIEGWVLLQFMISATGQAVSPVIIDADPPNIFNQSARSAVLKWKYRPKVENGRAVARPGVQQLISFELAK